MMGYACGTGFLRQGVRGFFIRAPALTKNSLRLPPPTPYRGMGGEFEGRAGDLPSPGPPLKLLFQLIHSPNGAR